MATMTLQHKDIVLRPLQESHKTNLAKLINNRNILDNLRDHIPFPYNEDHAELFINSVKDEVAKVTFGIEYQGAFCGIIGLVPQKDIYRHSAEIGYWIGEPFWGQGIASIAVSLLTNYGFETLDFLKIYASVFDYNTGSKRVLEKNGYHLEAVLKRGIIKNNIVLDEHRYVIFNPSI
jgi:[ribosomal protein S5]-alanine N-acetyltransferase